MIHDVSPRYSLGFGISPSDIPATTDSDGNVREGPNPYSGIVAKALHGHPVMRFFAASAAAMIGMKVAGSMIEKGGVRLASTLAKEGLPLIRKEYQSKLLNDFRALQRTLDEWEGLTRTPEGLLTNPDGTARKTLSHFSWKAIYHEKERAFKTGEDMRGPIHDWLLRDEIQQRLVRQARRLPYELPAMYITQRAVVDRITGTNQKDRPKWYNPVDVIGDFAQQSVKNIATMIVPNEVGMGTLSHGWRNLMTYGDFVSTVPHQNIHQFSIGLQSIMNMFGQSASDMIYKTLQVSHQSAGAFHNAISQGVAESRSWTEKGSAAKDIIGKKGIAKGIIPAAQKIFPKTEGFIRGLRESYAAQAEESANIEAVRTGQSSYTFKNVSHPTEYARVRTTGSIMERFATQVAEWRDVNYPQMRMTEEYKSLLVKNIAQELQGSGISPEMAESQARKFLENTKITLPQRNRTGIANERISKRIAFGDDLHVYDEIEPEFFAELHRRTGALGMTHGGRIMRALPKAVSNADDWFTQPSNMRTLRDKIAREQEQIYHGVILPYAKEKIPIQRLPNEMFGDGITTRHKELLVRAAAQHLGVSDMEHGKPIELGQLRLKLHDLGFHTDDHYDLKGFLSQEKVISAPWHFGGFNAFGMRKLSVEEAQRKNFFAKGSRGEVDKILGDIKASDPFTGDLTRRQVGNWIWETRGGKIIDLSSLRMSARTTVNALADNTQIPLLHTRPIHLFFYGLSRKLAEKPMFQSVSTFTSQEFMGGAEKPFTSLFWLRQRGLFSKGAVKGFTLDHPIQDLGTYHSGTTDTWSILGRHARLAIKNKGQYNPDAVENPARWSKDWFRKKFSLDEDQPHSVFRWLSRVRNNADDLQNPNVFARKLAAGEAPEEFDAAWAKGFLTWRRKMRTFAFTPKGGKSLSGLGLSEFFEAEDPGYPIRDKLGNITGHRRRNLSEVRTTDDMLRMAQREVDRSEEYIDSIDDPELKKETRRRLRSASAVVRKRYLRHANEPEYFNRGSAQAMQSTGIHRRLDEFRGDFLQMLFANRAIQEQDGMASIQRLLAGLDEAKAKNLIGGGEYVELRAAALSMQVHFFSIDSFNPQGSTRQRFADITRRMVSVPGNKSILASMGRYETETFHEGWPRKQIYGALKRRFGSSRYSYPGVEYNPFGDKPSVFIPTFKTAYKNQGMKAAASIAGLNTWSNPQAFSLGAIPMSHFYQRLNRYFGVLGLGLNETHFKGPLDLFARGLVMKRVLPAVAAGSIFMGVDRTLGGLVAGKDQYGNRQYRPLITGAAANVVAHAQMVGAGLIHGPQGYFDEKDKLYSGEVPVRKGRFWILSRGPWRGGRIQYFHPSWYQRFMAGSQYTSDDWPSPMKKLLYGDDFSPLRPFNPYYWENLHYKDRPYPVSGEYFSGPWGPLTSALNMTLGAVIKHPRKMHKQELADALSQYQRVGESGMAPTQRGPAYPVVATRMPTGSQTIMASRNAGEILGMTGGGPVSYRVGGSIGGGGFPVGGSGGGVGSSFGGASSRNSLGQVNAYYSSMSNSPSRGRGGYNPYDRTVLVNPQGFDPRLIPAYPLLSQGSLKYQAGALGYGTQEMLGIYGFMSSMARTTLGFGTQDFTPRRPVLTSASRGYGTERSFWDLNLGGFGDFPNASEGDYGNLEFSEIARRFVPHRRRDMNEINPIPNTMGQNFPWLPGADYFTNFHQGDPFTLVSEGESRLPGHGYELTHKLHPDITGQYGLVDQHAILGDIAPWSTEYKAIDKVVDQANLSPEQEAVVRNTRVKVAAIKKRHDFHNYLYSHKNFQSEDAKVTGFAPGEADVLMTTAGPIKLAGTKLRDTAAARQYAQSIVNAGDSVKITYDADRPPDYGSPISGIVTKNGVNINRALVNTEYAMPTSRVTPIDAAATQDIVSTSIKRMAENLAHKDNIITNKLFGWRSPVEDWERTNVYDTEFAQWQHPFRDFVKPLGFRAANRNPLVAAGVLAGVGSLFGTNPTTKAAYQIVGAGVGASLAMFSNAKSFEMGNRYIPLSRRKELGVEEYSDILNYVKYNRLYSSARQQALQQTGQDPETIARSIEGSSYNAMQYQNLNPVMAQALEYRRDIQQTMYGADVFGDVMNLSAAIPKRKRDHFLEFLNAPVSDRKRILSTAGRLERRIYEARWGMRVEKKPDLAGYFSEHELPPPNWEGWSPDVPSDAIKLKVAQSQGLDASQMGYYPQQIQEANLINVSYPDFQQKQSHRNAKAQLERIMASQGINGSVQAMPSIFPGSRIQMNGGVYS